jgi:branched-chain amino acid transport system substrate-binding protein
MKWLALLFALALAASACGSSSEEGSGDETETEGDVLDEGQQEAAEEAINSTSTTAADTEPTAEITSIEDYEALWADERAEIVASIEENGWGWDQEANTVTGPGGFSVDLSACPEGWDPYQGLEDGQILIGQTLAQSGTLADYGNIGAAQTIYYNYINEAGGITDSEGKTYTIVADQRDDAYDAAKTVPLVDELLDSEGVFAMQTLGSPNTMKVYDKINARCVPDPYVMSGHPAWGDPVNHPWVWGQQLAYNTEAILWGGLLESRFAGEDEITVAALIMQNDFGKAYELGFTEFTETSDLPIKFEYERIEPTAPTITNQMTTLASKNPDVFIAMTAGASCAQAITESANNGLKDTAQMLFMPSVCKAASFVGAEAVGGDGSASDGWWIVGGGAKDFTNAEMQENDVWVSFAVDLLEKGGKPIEGSASLGSGFLFSWPLVEALKIAAELPGGVSRPNLMVAARTLDMTNPNLLEGVHYNMAGNDDPYPTEGSEFAVYDAAAQAWVTQEDLGIIELSGKSAPCVWDQSTGSCN